MCLLAQSYPTLCNPMYFSLPGSSVHGDSPGKNTGVGCQCIYFLLQYMQSKPQEDTTSHLLSSVQLLSRVRLFATLWTVARQASLSFNISQSLLKLMSIESMMPPSISSSVVPLSSCPQSLPASGSFPMSQLFASGGQRIGTLAFLFSRAVISFPNSEYPVSRLTPTIL